MAVLLAWAGATAAAPSLDLSAYSPLLAGYLRTTEYGSSNEVAMQTQEQLGICVPVLSVSTNLKAVGSVRSFVSNSTKVAPSSDAYVRLLAFWGSSNSKGKVVEIRFPNVPFHLGELVGNVKIDLFDSVSPQFLDGSSGYVSAYRVGSSCLQQQPPLL